MRLAEALRGGLSLPAAFWFYGILVGTLINVLTTGFAFMAIALAAPNWLVLVVYFLPLPYDIGVLVAVWNSAARWAGARHWATAARITIVAWALAVIML